MPGGVEITTEKDAAGMALPREQAPGVRFAKSDEFFRQYADRSKAPSGLYIFGAGFIPHELPDMLKAASLTLKPDGTLVNAKGHPVTMIVWHRLVAAPGGQASHGAAHLAGRSRDRLRACRRAVSAGRVVVFV